MHLLRRCKTAWSIAPLCSSALSPDAGGKFRHSRLHFCPFAADGVLSVTSELVHIPDNVGFLLAGGRSISPDAGSLLVGGVSTRSRLENLRAPWRRPRSSCLCSPWRRPCSPARSLKESLLACALEEALLSLLALALRSLALEEALLTLEVAALLETRH